MIEILFTIAGTISVLAGSTQVRQLVRVGRSDEMSIPTWSLWFVTQIAAFSYAMTIHDPIFTTINGMWVILYGIMLGMILYYRRYPRLVEAEETASL